MKKLFVFLLVFLWFNPLFGEIFVEKTAVQAKIEAEQVILQLSVTCKKMEDSLEAIELFPKNVQLRAQTGPHLIKKEGGRFWYCLEKAGTYTSQFELTLVLDRQNDLTGFRFPYLSGTMAEFTLTIPAPEIKAHLDPNSILLSQTRQEKETLLKIAPSAQFQIYWQLGQTLLPDQELLAHAQLMGLVQILEGEIRYQTTLQIQVVRGKLEKLQMTYPASQKLITLAGPNFKWWEVQGDRISIHFKQPVERTAKIQLEFSQLYPELPAQIALEPIQIDGILIQKGTFALQKGEILSREIKTRDLEREDIENFQSLGKELVSAYEFRGKNPQLIVELKKRPPQVELMLNSNIHYYKELTVFQSIAHFKITEAKVENLQLLVPKELQIHSIKEWISSADLKVRSASQARLRNWEQEGTLVHLRLRDQQIGDISFILEGQLLSENGTIPSITSPQVKEISGKIGCSYTPELKLLIEQSDELIQINPQDLPKELFSERFQPKLAFSFRNKPYQLQLKTSLLKPSLSTTVQALYQITPEYLHFQALYQLTLKDVGLFQVEIPIPASMEITQVSAKEKTVESWNVQNSKILVKFLKETTQTSLQIQGILPAKEEQTLGIGFPEQSLKNEGFLALDPESELTLNVQKLSDLEEKPRSDYQGKLGNRGKVYRILGKNAQIQYLITPQNSEITGNVYTLYTFVRGYIVAQSEIVLNVQNAGIRKLSIRLPTKAGNLIITGQDVLDFYPREQDYQIELKNKVQGQLTFFVNYDLPFSIFGKSTCTMDGIDIPILKEIRGFEGWVKSEIPIEVLLEQQKGYEFKSQQDIPRESPSGKFKISRESYAIKERTRSFQLKINGLDQTQLQEVQISDLNIRTEVNTEGKLTTRLTCRFQNTTRQFLRVKVDQKAHLWGTYILKSPESQAVNKSKSAEPSEGKEPVKPTIGKNGEILVPIPKNIQDAQLEMIFVDQVEKMGYLGDLDLVSPAIEDVQIEKLSWDLVVPKNYLLLRHEGAFELKPVHSSLLPDTLVGFLQKEIAKGLNRFLPHFLKVSEQGAWTLFILFVIASFGFLLFAGYRYYGPDYFLLVCGKLVVLFVLFAIFVAICQKDLVYGLIFLSVLLFGWLGYRLREQIVDQLLLTEKGAFTPSRRTVFTLLILLTVIVVLDSMLLGSVKSALVGANATFKDGREFQELSQSSSYDDSADYGKHKTGRMEGDDDDHGGYSRNQNLSPTGSSLKKQGLHATESEPSDTSTLDSIAHSGKDMLEKAGDKRNRRDQFGAKPKKISEKLEKENADEEKSKKRENKPEEALTDMPASEEEPYLEREAKGLESDLDHNETGEDFDPSSTTEAKRREYSDEIRKKEPKAPEPPAVKTPPADPAVLAQEQQQIQVLMLQVEALQKKIQLGEVDRLGVEFANTYKNVQQGNFLVLQDQKQQLQAQLNVLQQQIGQQIMLEDKESSPQNAPGKSEGTLQNVAESSYRDGQQLLQQGQFQEAIQELNKALVFNPNNTRARQLLEESEKRLQLSEETSKELQKFWEKSGVHLENGELEEAEKLLDEIQRQGASLGRNNKIKTLIQQSQERKNLINERMAQLKNWQRMTKERIQQEIQNKFQLKLGSEIINIENFTCNYPQNPLVQVAVDKLLQQARVDLQNLRKSILNPDAFQQGLKTEGLSEQFARVKNGRSPGALPIPVTLPAENRVGFSFEVTLTDKPESIKFVFMNRNVSYFWQVILITLLWGGLYLLTRKSLQNGWIGILGSAALLASLYNFSDPEYLPYLTTGLYAIACYIPVIFYQTLLKKIEN